ncbi:DUF3299 domain-containing protein [Ferrimonas sp. YFM]|uniref:DUF3299 domain-containing protein n=1 Tax=Ferrimonas sp. YFM TaxID=3028878 RepID=UPI002573A1CA|nr:DUF3299 domain-containing protein [Ferrimonas sp. YFM]BDY05083.1 hypothetical protein F0521_21240 [Ferrimonas sp. YFM]
MTKPYLPLLAIMFTANAQASVIDLDWQQLRPQAQIESVSLPTLTEEQKRQLQRLLTLRSSNVPLDQATAASLEMDLASEGLDADHLLALRNKYIEQQQLAASTLTRQYDGQQVRIPGYLIPLEYSSEAMVVTEFLLVPYAGACIHMPPPPANQIVLVSFPGGYKLRNAKYPVWVEGTLTSQLATESVYIVDGTRDLTMGYRMSASLVEDYN